MRIDRVRFSRAGPTAALCVASLAGLLAPPAAAQMGSVYTTPNAPMELPVEVELETPPAASLKLVPLWKELYQLLEDPYLAPLYGTFLAPSAVERRPSFTTTPLPALNVWPLGYNFLTKQPMRIRTSDGEVSLDVPGALFDPDEAVPVDPFNVPLTMRTVIGALVASEDTVLDPLDFDDEDGGYLLVWNPDDDPRIPPDGTVVAVPAIVDGILQELDGESTIATVAVEELEIPINEEDFLRPELDTADVPPDLQPFIGRPAAEVLGKALFWDMQVGSDGVQACGSCHFHAGADNRTRNQLNPGTLGGNLTLEVTGPNMEVSAADFPFHKLANPMIPGEPLLNPGNVISDADDVMSSMGVSRFKQFVDLPPIGEFLPAHNGVAALPPDVGTELPDPVPVMQGLRRVEPRNTPTFHAAAFNFDNFWDGRARFLFNGGSVFGATDPQAHIFVDPDLPDALEGGINAHYRPDLLVEDPEIAEQPLRIKFSSLASQAVGPPLSDFEMSFAGRNIPKIGKKLLQAGVTPLANQLVAVDDSVLGPFSNQGGIQCLAAGAPTALGMPGLCMSYNDLIRLSFGRELWHNEVEHLDGTACADPFDGYCLAIAPLAAEPTDTNQFNQMEANFSLFFGQSIQAYVSLAIPDDTPFDRFMDANPLASNGIGQPGEQAVLFPTLIPELLGGGVTLIPDDPSTAEYDGFGEEEMLGMDLFMGGNLTAALPPGPVGMPGGPGNRNPQYTILNEDGESISIAVGSNPFTRSARCMLCHLGPEQTDHSINITHGIIKGDAEVEYPTPPFVPDPNSPSVFADGLLPAPEPPGQLATVGGLILAEEVEEAAQDSIEVEPRDFAVVDDPATPWDDRVVAQPSRFSLGDQGIYNLGVRPTAEDVGRGGLDPFGWPLSMAALALKNIGGPAFEPGTLMATVDPTDFSLTFEESGGGVDYPGAPGYTLQSINPGFERSPVTPLLPEYLAPWVNGLPAGELHPQIDEMAGMAPNTLTPPNGGPLVEFPEVMFGADLHCGVYDPETYGAGPPNFGWGPSCPTPQSGTTGNFGFPVHGTWPTPNQVLKDGAFKAPSLRNVELTGPYFHTGSYLTLRQVVDFYMRGGDFPISNAEHRDPHMVDVVHQAFGFGRTTGDDLGPVDTFVNGFQLIGNFADALPDTVYRYDEMPDTDHPLTPEYLTEEEARSALVRFLLSLTDPRVRYDRAPFDHPEIIVPVDGTAPDNTGGRPALLADARFLHVEAVGAEGRATPLEPFLVSSVEGDPGLDHFDADTSWTVPDAQADLQSGQTVQQAKAMALPGDSVTFELQISNTGPFNVSDAQVTDIFPDGLVDVDWTCRGFGGFCTGWGFGHINEAVDLPSGSWVTFSVSATVAPSAAGQTLHNVVSVSSIVTDPDLTDNQASTVVTVLDPANGQPLFWDDVETGDTSRWASAEP